MIEIQTGLLLEEYPIVIGGVTYNRRKLHSAVGYHFYDIDQPENYDENGNLRDDKVYLTNISLAFSMGTWTHEQLNTKYISEIDNK